MADAIGPGRGGALATLRNVTCGDDLRPEYRVRLRRWKETKSTESTGEGRTTNPVFSALTCNQKFLFLRGGSRVGGAGGVVVAPKSCGSSWCVSCAGKARREALSGVETFDPPPGERWYMLRLTMPERVRSREQVREFASTVQRWMRSATRADHGRPWASAAWCVFEVVPKPLELGGEVPCPCVHPTGRRSASAREALTAALDGNAGPGGLFADVLEQELRQQEEVARGLQWVDGRCCVCRGSGFVSVCHVHAHVVVAARPFWWGDETNMESAAAAAELEGRTSLAAGLRAGDYRPCPGGGGFVAWARSFGLGSVHVDEVKAGRAGAAAYLGKVCDYAGKLVDGGKVEEFARALGLLVGTEDDEVRAACVDEARRAWGFTHGATFDGCKTVRTAGGASGRRVVTRDGLVTGTVPPEEASKVVGGDKARRDAARGLPHRASLLDWPAPLDLSTLKVEATAEARPRVVVETVRWTENELETDVPGNLSFPKRDKLPPVGGGRQAGALPEFGGVALRCLNGWWAAAAGNGRGTVTRDGGALASWLREVVPDGIPVVWLDGVTGEPLTEQEVPL